MNWKIPKILPQLQEPPYSIPVEGLQITIEADMPLFIVGANGSGKSALLQHFVSSDLNGKIRRISAHRQTWFESGSADLTPQSRKAFEENNRRVEQANEARWKDYNSAKKQSAILVDMIAKENERARHITGQVGNQNMKEAAKFFTELPSPFEQINKLLELGNLKVTIELSEGEEIIAQHQNASEPFSIAQMSDGERSAVIIAMNVLTVESGTVLLIDEPERHLHRSIIEPFLSALFKQRPDCAFVISTHEVALPLANPEARVLMVRSCSWANSQPNAWDVEILEANNRDLPEDLKRAILGSRKKILFVEGDEYKSLDQPLYSVLFPDISVLSKGSCDEVIKAVKGLRESWELHHVEAFGLIDRDNRDEDEIKRLSQNNVFALDVYSVEALYYCSDAIAAVAHRQAESLSYDFDNMIEEVKQKVLNALKEENFAEKMAAQRSEHKVRALILSKIPNWKFIKDNESLVINIPAFFYQEELNRFKELVSNDQLDDLVACYPLRKSDVFSVISKALKLTGRDVYKRTLLSQIQNDKSLVDKLRQRVGPLSDALIGQSKIT